MVHEQHLAKITISKIRRDLGKKFHMIAATMSRYAIGGCLRIYLKNRRKTEFNKGLNKLKPKNFAISSKHLIINKDEANL